MCLHLAAPLSVFFHSFKQQGQSLRCSNTEVFPNHAGTGKGSLVGEGGRRSSFIIMSPSSSFAAFAALPLALTVDSDLTDEVLAFREPLAGLTFS